MTEARYWYRGERDPDTTASLVHVWLHFDQRPPTELHACGDKLELSTADPYGDTGLGEFGEIRVAPAGAPDLLADMVGRRMTNAAVILDAFDPSACAGMLLRLDGVDIVVGTFCDEWVLAVGQPPPHLAPYWRPQQWLTHD